VDPYAYVKEEAMHTRVLIDQIMRQTTVLIAQLSTAAGIRAPLSHIADEVFLNLSSSIEEQGVSRKVAADMFGMALRTYQRRVQSLAESASVKERTLWEAVFEYISSAEEGRSREELLHRFRWDEEASVKAVLHDLVNTHVVELSGERGEQRYTLLDSPRRPGEERRDNLEAFLWVHIYLRGPQSAPVAAQQLKLSEAEVCEAIAQLVTQGRLTELSSKRLSEAPLYEAKRCWLPFDQAIGWEAAVYDHYQAMVKAIANKLNRIGAIASRHDKIGGATLSFNLYPGHPHEAEVLSLLERQRAELNELWARVVDANQLEPPAQFDESYKVTFYLGQNVEECSNAERSTDGHEGG